MRHLKVAPSWLMLVAGFTATTLVANEPDQGKMEHILFAAAFENQSQKPSYEGAAAGMGDLVGALLSEHETVRVVERQQLKALAAEQAISLRGLTDRNYALAAGRLLEADTVLLGRLFEVDHKLMITTQVVDIATDRVLASAEVAGTANDLPKAAAEVAAELAGDLKLPLKDTDQMDTDPSPKASLEFCQGLSSYFRGEPIAAVMHFMKCMDLDPNYVEALYWSGEAYVALEEPYHAGIDWREFLKRSPDDARIRQVELKLSKLEAQLPSTPKLLPLTTSPEKDK